MKGNFYSNPLKLIWIARLNLLPVYLFIIWILICCILFLGSIVFDFINFESFDIANFFTASITGLTFTLAIFTAERNVFKIDELKVLAEYKGEKDKYKGKALLEFFGPFVFTSLIFLTTGLLALIVPFINVRVCSDVSDFFIQSYLDILVLGLFSLFNLVVTILNDVYHSINREN
ncbi:hypothetical protein HCJ21_11520 [Listeria seeligeri]|uniref:hypothetical protein n=2 Tax=Listeria seeligeri TaxID=1640 RepID=UPI00162A9B8C|nr:hypothetical protein [Listeria seeligeri]MBC1596408.1 hypothetical protein [Listeria seeligeri]MBC1600037.1 hypothetical protein [Listeria seeligeri]MBC2045184.1 hypothetical protein [Listeria seeligeri]MBC2051690.1 hypothetical protein [Listeria seeligeri]MBC2060143.1 hypothetical protein [Listeria seeligeri]